jgi:hypothetical protein
VQVAAKIQKSFTEFSKSFGHDANLRADTYSNSIPYYLLTGRKGLQIYTHQNTYVTACDHPHIDGQRLLFPEIKGDGTLTADILRHEKKPENGFRLARYTQHDLHILASALNAAGQSKIAIQHSEERVLDWRYPAHILDTAQTGNMKGKPFEKLRNKFNKASAQLTILPLSDSKGLNIMRASLMFWVGTMIYIGKETGHDMTAFYETLFQTIKDYPSMFDGFAILYGNEPAGFTVWDTTTGKTANALAGLSRRSVPGMSEFQTVTACRILKAKGVDYFNLGGSEEAGLDTHKREYQPVRNIDLKSYDVIYGDTNRLPYRKHVLVQSASAQTASQRYG